MRNTPTRKASPRPTMTDIATLVGVSQSTVSLVLNEMTGAKVSKGTRNKIFSAARELDYQLPRSRSAAVTLPALMAPHAGRHVVAYIADGVATSSHPALTIEGARTAAWERHCILSVYVTGGDRELEEAVLSAVCAQPTVLGLIYATTFTREVMLPPLATQLPCVLLNCTTRPRSVSSVVPGEVAGGSTATEHLIAHGHTRIGFINGEPWMDAARDRLRGYKQALATADLPFDPDLVCEGDWMSGSGFDHTMKLMQLKRPPSAIFCANDLMALGALDALKVLRIDVPSQVSVLGYDDQEVARHAHPPLSTVLLPNFAMGYWAVERLCDEALSSTVAPMHIKMDCPLVPRTSVNTLINNISVITNI